MTLWSITFYFTGVIRSNLHEFCKFQQGEKVPVRADEGNFFKLTEWQFKNCPYIKKIKVEINDILTLYYTNINYLTF